MALFCIDFFSLLKEQLPTKEHILVKEQSSHPS